MKRFLLILFVVSALFVLSVPSFANVFNLGPGLTNLETVLVGDPGNAGELSGRSIPGGMGDDRICGAVAYSYNIGKHEVTAGQYCDFLNAVARVDTHRLYDADMSNISQYDHGCNIQRSGSPGSYTYSVAADWANRPVNYVSFWSACRFVNWLQNGQPSGQQDLSTTEDGAYYLNGDSECLVQRRTGWKWAVTSEDEWYKAAYYKGGGRNAGYWFYPTRSYMPPSNVGADGYTDPGNHANLSWNYTYTIGNPYWRTNVGEFENSESPYGTFDQAGNLFEFTDTVYLTAPSIYYVSRGGNFANDHTCTQASARGYTFPSNTGFRVVQAVPEPSALVVLVGGVGILFGLRRRRA